MSYFKWHSDAFMKRCGLEKGAGLADNNMKLLRTNSSANCRIALR